FDPFKILSKSSAFNPEFCPYAKHGKGAESGLERIDAGHLALQWNLAFSILATDFYPIKKLNRGTLE
ncbi:MAG: hypothetical protein ACRESL_22570, partial [Pseudomonas sp.]